MSKTRIPGGVWALGFTSLLMDVSSELVHSLLPLFMTTVLGTSALTVGLVDGAAEATVQLVKVISGPLSDALGRRKPLAVLGYALGALSKPLFAVAVGAGGVLGARLVDRTGKGIRGAPRDALVAELTPPEIRGAAYGLRQALDTVGAFAGPLLATALMLMWANDFRRIFWVAVVPGALSVVVLLVGVHEPPQDLRAPRPNPLARDMLRQLSASYWSVVTLGGLFSLARFSEAFLVLRGQDSGLAPAWAPMILVAMNLVFAAVAYPFGKLSDRIPHYRLLTWGVGVLIVADAVLAVAASPALVFVGVGLWGLHMGMTQGLLSAMVAHTAPPTLRGTAFGLFNLVSGAATLLASVTAGILWDRFGAPATFAAGAVLCGVALVYAITCDDR